jgi:enoyl-CoA hydratase/carnithine racemase
MGEFAMTTQSHALVLPHRKAHMMSIVLNRPRAINSLNIEMIRTIRTVLDEVQNTQHYRYVLFYGAGDRGFCAGGDIKALARSIQEQASLRADLILKQEYDLLLRIHHFPKPVIVLADGITMGAGLGVAAAADLVVATEHTRMAMPETRIGFFPDVGATGWMFAKCPPGYPEYLGLTGYEMFGAEAVRVGLADYLTDSSRLPELIEIIETCPDDLPETKNQAVRKLIRFLDPFFKNDIPVRTEMDDWVATYFAGRSAITQIIASLKECSIQIGPCEQVFQRLSERSPTSVVLTLMLLRHNEHRSIEEVFQADLKAARFILNHPDFVEGVRARLIEKDNKPRWQPKTFEAVGPLNLKL